MKPRTALARFFLLAAFTCLLLACSKSIVIETDFPEPLVPSLPLTVGLHYGDTITNYSYQEDLPYDEDWSFELHETNAKLFDKIFAALFDQTIHVEEIGGNAAPYSELDAIIEPSVEAFEFSLPRQSQSDQYAVWIRYNLKIYTPDGNLITSWPISAYGQSDSRMFGASKAMEKATINALRDAAVSIVTGFEKQPKIREALLTEHGDDDSQSSSTQ
jgi:hypothetical protein